MSSYDVLEPDKWHPLRGSIDIHPTSGGAVGKSVRISLTDDLSGIEFAEIELSVEAFGEAVTGLGNVRGRVRVNGLEYVGMKHEREPARIEFPRELHSYSSRDALVKWLEENAKRDGWKLNTYLGSQRSIEHDQKTGKVYANVTYHRYVKVGPKHGTEDSQDHDQVQR